MIILTIKLNYLITEFAISNLVSSGLNAIWTIYSCIRKKIRLYVLIWNIKRDTYMAYAEI